MLPHLGKPTADLSPQNSTQGQDMTTLTRDASHGRDLGGFMMSVSAPKCEHLRETGIDGPKGRGVHGRARLGQ